MRKYFRFKRLKIAEQILVVLLGAVIIPMAISGFIINNINQQSIRSQLKDSAVLVTQIVSEEIDVFLISSMNELNQIKFTMEYLNGGIGAKKKYLSRVLKNSPEFENLTILKSPDELMKLHEHNLQSNSISIYTKTKNNDFLVATFNAKFVRDKLFRSLKEDKREIYVLSSAGKLVGAHNYVEKDYQNTLNICLKNLKLVLQSFLGE